MSENLKFEIINDGKILRVTAENPVDFAEYIKDHEDDALTSYTPNSDQAFMELTGQYQGNGWFITTADKLGHMSECLLISNDFEMDDDGNYSTDKFYTNIADYQIISPLYCILEDGHYDFELSE